MSRTFDTRRRMLLRAIDRIAPRSRPAGAPDPFVLLSTQRSGSTWLLEHLHAHPAIFMFAELFLNDGEGLPRFAGDGKLPFFNTYARNAGMRASWLDARRVLRSYLDEVYGPRADARSVGFKLMYSQVPRVPQLVLHLAWRRVKVLHLVRRNLVDVFLSKKAREERGFAHAPPGQKVSPVRSRLDPEELLAFVDRITREHETWRRELDRAGLRRHELVYEDLVRERAGLDDAVRFLGLEPVRAGGEDRLQKLSRASHAEQIANYDEVARALEGTPHAGMLQAQARTEPAE